MYPQFVDINNDGFNDIVTGTYYGYAWWVRGTADGFSEAEPIKDKSGAKIGLPESDDENVDVIASATAVDWDRDGDLDLLLGGLLLGELYVRRNEGTPEKPVFSTENEPVIVRGEDSIVKVGGGIHSPTAVDWDGDGNLDVLVGCSDGGVYWFRNESKTGEFELAAAKTLVKPSDGEPMLNGEANKVGPNSSCYVHVCDYDGDSDLDLLVSGISYWQTPPEREPTTPDEKRMLIEIETLDSQLKALTPESLSDEEYEKVLDSDEFAKLEERSNELYGKAKQFMPGFGSGHSVWIFRNQKAKPKPEK